jgi:CHAD domain-containing protein
MAAQDALEVERKYNVEAETPIPPLEGLPEVGRVGAPVTHTLEAVYFDTEDFALAANRITLRRRTGGKDAGWHLKLPGKAGARTEVTEPLGADGARVPERLRHLVSVHTRAKDLGPVARLTTRRTVVLLLDTQGSALAEFCDDHVESEAPPAGGLRQAWREWEIELIGGEEGLLSAADDLLADEGVHPAELPSKLARALGPSYPKRPERAARPKRKGPAGVVLLARLQAQAEALKAMDPQVRQDAPDAVHQLRVAARRMRSALATFRPFVDAERANRLRDELKWLSQTVGQARDVEVMRGRLAELTGGEPAALVVGPVAERIRRESEDRYRQAHEVGLVALDSERYFRLLDTLDAFLAEPPLSERAGKAARKAVAKRVAKDIERLHDAVDAAEEAEDDDADQDTIDAALHEVRKKAKRLRYAAEAARPVLGKRAKRLARAAEQIQETLGELQDSVVSREHLLGLAAQAHEEGDSAFSFGRLHALEEQRAAEARTRFALDWADFTERHP